MIAAREGHTEVVKAMLAAGADPSLRNKKRETAKETATVSGHSTIAAMFR